MTLSVHDNDSSMVLMELGEELLMGFNYKSINNPKLKIHMKEILTVRFRALCVSNLDFADPHNKPKELLSRAYEYMARSCYVVDFTFTDSKPTDDNSETIVIDFINESVFIV